MKKRKNQPSPGRFLRRSRSYGGQDGLAGAKEEIYQTIGKSFRQQALYFFVPAILLAVLVISGCGGSFESNLNRGLEKLHDGNYNAAAGFLEKAAEQNPASTSARCNLGIAYWKLGRHKDAISCFKKAAQLCPEDVRPLEFLAQVMMDMQNWNEARSVLIQADKRLPSSARILTTMALVEFRAENNSQALSRLTQALEVDPSYAPALYNMAVLHRDRLNNKDAAANYFMKYQKVAGEDLHSKSVPQFLDREPPAGPGQQSREKQSQIDPVIAGARKAIDRQEFDSALEMLKQAVRNNPADPAPLWELALLYDKHLKFEGKATEYYRKFLQQFPNDARAASIQKRIEELRPSAKVQVKHEAKPAAVNQDPDAAQSAFQEGLNHLNNQKWDDAIACYKRAFALDNSLAFAAYNLGLAYKGKGDINSAKQAFSQALALDPNMTKAHYMMAVVFNMQNDNKQAIEHLNKIFRVDPDYARAHHLMGIILKDANDIDGAKSHFEKYIKLVPDDPAAKATQEWLNQQR